MRFLTLAMCCLISGSLAAADEPTPVPEPDTIGVPAIRLPLQPQPVGPPAPQPVTVLAEDHWYVIESDVPLIVLASRVGYVSITPDKGPLRVKGKFADGTGKVETRSYTGEYLFLVEAVAKGEVELLVVPVGAQDESVVLRRTLSVMGARPPPKPVDPDVDPVPVDPTFGPLTITIIEETAARSTLPSSQLVTLTGAKLREYANSHCSKAEDGTPNLRLLDADADVSKDPKWLREAFAEPRASVPWIVVSNSFAGFSGPLPLDEQQTIELLQKYGGK